MRKGNVEDRFVSLVRPGEIPKVTPFITELTGITRGMVSDAPMPDVVLPELFAFIGDDMVVGHNVCFDMNFLYDGALKIGIEPIGNDFTDTMRISRRTYRELPNHRLGTLAQYLSVVPNGAHRAAADVETTIGCYEKMVKSRCARFPDFRDRSGYPGGDLRKQPQGGQGDRYDPFVPGACVRRATILLPGWDKGKRPDS